MEPVWSQSVGTSEISHRVLHTTGGAGPGVSRAASMSLSNQGIHCCLGSGYSLAMGPHPALLAVRCRLELPADARFLDMDIKGICLEKRTDECRGRGVKKKNTPPRPPSALKLAARVRSLGRRATPS